jgi:hypothetical protein
LEILVRLKPFQGVALTPGQKSSFPAPYRVVGVRGLSAFIRRRVQDTMTSDFLKAISAEKKAGSVF